MAINTRLKTEFSKKTRYDETLVDPTNTPSTVQVQPTPPQSAPSVSNSALSGGIPNVPAGIDAHDMSNPQYVAGLKNGATATLAALKQRAARQDPSVQTAAQPTVTATVQPAPLQNLFTGFAGQSPFASMLSGAVQGMTFAKQQTLSGQPAQPLNNGPRTIDPINPTPQNPNPPNQFPAAQSTLAAGQQALPQTPGQAPTISVSPNRVAVPGVDQIAQGANPGAGGGNVAAVQAQIDAQNAKNQPHGWRGAVGQIVKGALGGMGSNFAPRQYDANAEQEKLKAAQIYQTQLHQLAHAQTMDDADADTQKKYYAGQQAMIDAMQKQGVQGTQITGGVQGLNSYIQSADNGDQHKSTFVHTQDAKGNDIITAFPNNDFASVTGNDAVKMYQGVGMSPDNPIYKSAVAAGDNKFLSVNQANQSMNDARASAVKAYDTQAAADAADKHKVAVYNQTVGATKTAEDQAKVAALQAKSTTEQARIHAIAENALRNNLSLDQVDAKDRADVGVDLGINHPSLDQGSLVNTSTNRTMQQNAPGVLDLASKAAALITAQQNKLGPGSSRERAFMQGTIGTSDPQFAQLRTDTNLLVTKLMRMHVGARGGEQMMQHFNETVGDISKQSPANLLASLREIQGYANEVQNQGPRGKDGKPYPGEPSATTAQSATNSGANDTSAAPIGTRRIINGVPRVATTNGWARQ